MTFLPLASASTGPPRNALTCTCCSLASAPGPPPMRLPDGGLPAYGATVTISPDGAIRLSKGRWSADIPASQDT